MTLGAFLEEYFRLLDVKQSTLTIYGHTRRYLEAFFGKEKLVRAIDAKGADDWRAHLKNEGLAESTIARRVIAARSMFRRACKWKITSENPFADVKGGAQRNHARYYFVTRQEAEKVLAACPDAEWRLIFALSRFGGLRCPSEHLELRWSDVDWKNNRVLIRSPKTARHPGGDRRLIPLFPELRPYFKEVFDAAPKGAEFVITRYRLPNVNLRTQLLRILKKAGLKPWNKLFHNLRSTRQTELTRDHPEHVVCAWLGNKEKVARDHYLQLTNAHFDAAVVEAGSGAVAVAQNAAQQPAAGHGSSLQLLAMAEVGTNITSGGCEQLQNDATPCICKGLQQMGAVGFEGTGKVRNLRENRAVLLRLTGRLTENPPNAPPVPHYRRTFRRWLRRGRGCRRH